MKDELKTARAEGGREVSAITRQGSKTVTAETKRSGLTRSSNESSDWLDFRLSGYEDSYPLKPCPGRRVNS